ncbi:hypothetical protein Tco_0689918 [Tanacetum coccineum]
MNPTAASQIALDNALVPPEARLKIGECNRRIKISKPQREATYQVTLDALKLSSCYPAILINAGVPEIYMHQFWNTVTKEHQVYGALIPKEMINEDILNSTAYQTYFAYASGAKEPKMDKKFKKPASPKLKTVLVSPKEPTKKPAKKTVPKALVKGKISKGIEIISDAAITEAAQLKEATKRSKKDFQISQTSGSGDGTDFESGVPDEQQRKISDADKGTGTKLGVTDVPKYDSKSEKESWGDSGEEDDDDEDDYEDEDNDDNDNDDGDHDDNDDDSDHERTESDRDEYPDRSHES